MSLILSDNGTLLNDGSVLSKPIDSWRFSLSMSISSDLIDSELTDFPLLVHLSTESGITSADTSIIFDELGNNSKRISIQNDQGEELPVEVESWSNASNEAYLWVKVPTVSASQDTELTLYYDNWHPNNTNNIFDTASVSASQIWDSNYRAVWHLSESGVNDRLDSSSYDIEAVTQNYDGDENINGKINGADDLDGTDQYLDTLSDSSDFNINSNKPASISLWAKPNDQRYLFVCGGGGPSGRTQYAIEGQTTTTKWILDISFFTLQSAAGKCNAGEWSHIYVTYNNPTVSLYVNGILEGTISHNLNIGTSLGCTIGNRFSNYFNGPIDEVRISDTTRSADYVKADYLSNIDSLITYS
jgi:hypothetical protein